MATIITDKLPKLSTREATYNVSKARLKLLGPQISRELVLEGRRYGVPESIEPDSKEIPEYDMVLYTWKWWEIEL